MQGGCGFVPSSAPNSAFEGGAPQAERTRPTRRGPVDSAYCEAAEALAAFAPLVTCTAGEEADTAAAFCSSYSRLPLIALKKNVPITISTITTISTATRVVGFVGLGWRGSFIGGMNGR